MHPPISWIAASLLSACLVFGQPAVSFSASMGCAPRPASLFLVNVTDRGARGDGQTDDTSAIQAAIDEVSEKGGTVLVPNGTYMVSAVRDNRLSLKSNVTLRLASGAVLKAIPNDSEKYSVLHVSDASNVAVIGGMLEGERDQHLGKTGEWGMGIWIGEGADHVTISGVTVTKMLGDGFYIQGANDVKLCSVTADNNRRQGLSIIQVNGLEVKNSAFQNTHGTRPSAGIDIEPDNDEQHVANVRIHDCQFLNNAGPGIGVVAKKSLVSNIEITRNNFFGNHHPLIVKGACGRENAAYDTEQLGGGGFAYIDVTELVIAKNRCLRPRGRRQ
jgi:Pectate lyase superfamily protein